MFRNDVAMTPLRVKQAIDSRFVKPSGDKLNVLINGTWVEFFRLPPVVNCTELLTMYKYDTTLTETPVINATGCKSLDSVFIGCTNLETVKYIHMPSVNSMHSIFRNCSSLTSVPEMDTSKVNIMSYMFYQCYSLTIVPDLDMSSAVRVDNMFYSCNSLTIAPEMDISNATNVNNMFRVCSSLTTVVGLDMRSVTDAEGMFRGCTSLTSVTFTGDVVPPYGDRMFNNAPIASGNGYIFVPDNMVNAYKTASGWSTHASVIKGISEKGALQSNINMYNLQIEENPTMFAMREEELM